MAVKSRVSRRRVLRGAGMAALAGSAHSLFGRDVAAQGGAPAIATNTQAGRRFRAFVKWSRQPAAVVELTARALTGNEVLLRVDAAQTCYTEVDNALVDGTPAYSPAILGHGGVGVIEAIGPAVASVRVGDRVILNLHPACGRCYSCLHTRSDKCRLLQQAYPPIATMADGTQVFGRTGAMSELAITGEEFVTPIFTDVPAPEIAMLTCVGGCGLGMATTNCPVEIASDVVIFGGGPTGLSAVQGARLKGAARIIVVEPIPYRRDLAMKLGATDVVDPNQYTTRTRRDLSNLPDAVSSQADRFTDALVDHLRQLTRESTDRFWAGAGRNGPQHVIEAVGGDRWKPRRHPQGPDPTGATALQQCWELGSSIGTIVTCSVGHPVAASVTFPAAQWADGSKHHWPGTGGGTNDRRDSPKYIRLMGTGRLDFKSMVGGTYRLADAREAYQLCADRELISTVVTPNV